MLVFILSFQIHQAAPGTNRNKPTAMWSHGNRLGFIDRIIVSTHMLNKISKREYKATVDKPS